VIKKGKRFLGSAENEKGKPLCVLGVSSVAGGENIKTTISLSYISLPIKAK
jgi:hypothetical protein